MRIADSLHDLVARFNDDAAKLREYGDHRMAQVCQQHADAVLRAIEQDGDEILGLQEASRISGYTIDHLGRLIRAGRLPNAGRRHAPAIRRLDLPLKPGRGVSTPSPAAGVASRSEIARFVLQPGGQDA